MEDKLATRYDLLIESIENICKTKNITCVTSSQTHWTFFKLIRSDGVSVQYEMNWMYFINSGSNDLIIHEISRKIDELIAAQYLQALL